MPFIPKDCKCIATVKGQIMEIFIFGIVQK